VDAAYRRHGRLYRRAEPGEGVRETRDLRHKRAPCTPTYREAFNECLRHGTPLDLASKADGRRAETHPTTHYVWRTQGDARVRASHRANDGKIFAWDDPPPTGHPGEDYGCRCRAEPYAPDATEFIDLSLSNVTDTGAAWTSLDFVAHYVFGGGRAVLLRDTGHLEAVVEEYRRQAEGDLQGQIADAARANAGTSFKYGFGRPYNMRGVVFSLGSTTIGGVFLGRSEDHGSALTIDGRIIFNLADAFTDPVDIRERIEEQGLDSLTDYQGNIWPGKPYIIVDEWLSSVSGKVVKDRSNSRYTYDG
jgi:hypothetical protein